MIGCASVIANLGKARGKQTKKAEPIRRRLPPAASSSNLLLRPIDSMRAIEFQCISDEMVEVGGGGGREKRKKKQTPAYLSTQMDWQADARSGRQAISAWASFK